jgi:uncharacterized protein (TIGR02246 family)
MRRRFGVLLALALFGQVGCAPQATPVDREAELASLVAADARYAEVGGTKDLEGMMALYAVDAMMYAPETAPASGLEGVREVMEAFMADPNGAGSFTPLYAEVSADADMGYTMSEAAITLTGPDGMPVTEHVRDFHVWRKQADGTWRIVVDIWNAAPPPPM